MTKEGNEGRKWEIKEEKTEVEKGITKGESQGGRRRESEGRIGERT